jgi:hypothetical protein
MKRILFVVSIIATIATAAVAVAVAITLANKYYRRRLKHHIEVEGYASRWNETDARVRKVSLEEYISSVRMPTPMERIKLWGLSVLVFTKGEGGLPHTHGPFIMLPESLIPHIDTTTLAHESIHIQQRYHPAETIKKIIDAFPITGFVYPEDNHRANPDTSRILFGDIRPRWSEHAVSLTDITDPRDHPFELMAYGNEYKPLIL